ncbi:MAG: ESPR-type extended signal peptide-containing protein [Negativicoccus succinicivorans]|nr:ESPR-type extended signal peptide-containing protein [Negativicoccus succinicivorans]
MNRVYKVIWNRGKNSCSVVSEIAKNHGKVSSCRNKVVLAAMVLSLLSVDGLAYAEDPVTPAPEPDNGIHYFSVYANDSAKPEGTNWNNDGAKGLAAVAVGPYAGAQGDYGTAVGPYAQADGVQASAFGVAAKATGAAATAAGTNAVAGGASAAAFGASANAGGDNATAVGVGANAAGAAAAATGAYANAAGAASSAFGLRAQAKSNESLAVGAFAEAEKHAAAIGSQAKAIGEQSVAVGGKAEAQAAFGLALGTMASATQQGGIALGAGSLADRQARAWGFDVSSGKAMNEDALLGAKKAEYEQEAGKLVGLRGELQQLQTQYVESITNDPVGPNGTRIPSDETKQIEENMKNKENELKAQLKLVNEYVNVWQSTNGAVSVGNAEAGDTRQITGVAAGTDDTDAVNVAQIKAITKQMEAQATHYFSVNADDHEKPADTNWNNDGATGTAAIAVGRKAVAQGDYGAAVGHNAQASGQHAIAAGSSAVAGAKNASAFGALAKATGADATAVGSFTVAGGKSAAAFGSLANAGGDAATAVGYSANAAGGTSVATGAFANAAGVASSALGFRAQAKSNESVAVGAYTEAEKHAAALGPQAKAIGERSVAVGGKAEAQAVGSLAIGSLATATQRGSVALGRDSIADRQARVWGFDAFAGEAMNEDALLGDKKAERAQAIDKLTGLRGELQQLRTEFEESSKKDPIGQDGKRIPSDATKQIQENLKNKTDEFEAQLKLVNGYVNAWQSTDGAVSVGNAKVGVTRQITGVAAGTEDTDAVNVVQLKKLASNINEQMTGLDTRITTNTENITVLNGRVDQLDTRVDRIGAGAAALAGLHPLDFDPDDKWDFAASYGNYKGAHALAIGAFYRPNESKMFSVGGSFGGGENMLNIGFSMKVGRGNEYMKLSRSEMAQQLDAQAQKLDEQAQKLDAQTQKLDAQDEQIRDMQAEMKAITQKLATLQAQSGK